jgi:hypothetical protein
MRALAPARRDTFLCSAKEKYPKERRPGGLPHYTSISACVMVSPALLVKTGACSTRDLAALDRSNTRKLHPVFTAMLGCAYGGVDLKPVALTEYRSQSGKQVRTMSEGGYGAKPRKPPSCARPRIGEERRGPASAGECSGGLSLWVLSLGQARESTSPRGRESPHQKQSRLQGALSTAPVIRTAAVSVFPESGSLFPSATPGCRNRCEYFRRSVPVRARVRSHNGFAETTSSG